MTSRVKTMVNAASSFPLLLLASSVERCSICANWGTLLRGKMSPGSFADLPVEIRLHILKLARRQSFRERYDAKQVFPPKVMTLNEFGRWHWCADRFSREGEWTSSVRVWVSNDTVCTQFNVRNEYAYHTAAEKLRWFESLVEDKDMAVRCATKSQPQGSTTAHMNWDRWSHWVLDSYLTQRATFSAKDCCM